MLDRLGAAGCDVQLSGQRKWATRPPRMSLRTPEWTQTATIASMSKRAWISRIWRPLRGIPGGQERGRVPNATPMRRCICAQRLDKSKAM